MGGKYHLKLNIGTRPIANKYREGKMKSTLKRELKACETVKKETIKVSSARRAISRAASGLGSASPVLGARPVYLCGVRVSIVFCGGRGLCMRDWASAWCAAGACRGGERGSSLIGPGRWMACCTSGEHALREV